jgi:putative ABC transport system ATP-binding protein
MTMSDTALRLEAVSKVYGEGDIAVHAVTDVTLAVEPGETVLIMGPSGSGKTTLLLMAGTLLRPSSGQVVLDGEEVSALSGKQLPALRLRRIGFVFQLFNLLENLTAAENVSIVMEAAGTRRRLARQQACDLLRELRLDTRADARPETLSVGERQRVAIARALANDPRAVSRAFALGSGIRHALYADPRALGTLFDTLPVAGVDAADPDADSLLLPIPSRPSRSAHAARRRRGCDR